MQLIARVNSLRCDFSLSQWRVSILNSLVAQIYQHIFPREVIIR